MAQRYPAQWLSQLRFIGQCHMLGRGTRHIDTSLTASKYQYDSSPAIIRVPCIQGYWTYLQAIHTTFMIMPIQALCRQSANQGYLITSSVAVNMHPNQHGSATGRGRPVGEDSRLPTEPRHPSTPPKTSQCLVQV